MASLRYIGKPDDDKKSSIVAKMGNMLADARQNGQKPVRWIVRLDFMLKLIEEVNLPPSWNYPLRPEFMGLPMDVDHHLIHDCILDVE